MLGRRGAESPAVSGVLSRAPRRQRRGLAAQGSSLGHTGQDGRRLRTGFLGERVAAACLSSSRDAYLIRPTVPGIPGD